ncbi:hypothetical protein Tco_1036123 [Tanacetum coccineum]
MSIPSLWPCMCASAALLEWIYHKKQTGSNKTKTPPTAKGKRLKTSQSWLNLPRRSNLQRVPDVPTYASDDEQISWKSSDEEDDDEVEMSGDDDDDDNQDDDDNDDDY